MKKLFIILLFLSTASYISAEDIFEFKGIYLKSNISLIEKDNRFFCNEIKATTADKICALKTGEKETIAGVSVKSIAYSYYDDILESIFITFNEDDFTNVCNALFQKYGTVEPEISKVRNRMGTEFQNIKYRWRKGSATLSAIRFGGDLKTSVVSFRTDSGAEEFVRRQKVSVKKSAGDL